MPRHASRRGQETVPVVLGGGRPVCPDGPERLDLRLAGSRVFDGRTVLLRYPRPAG
ncbi:hypothetical protein [Micromonospora sp. NPDC050200]|uniref:hypothetical protein n=1 Tax=Micromonospora sp. NPDC050200 TaxID=3155664 RepID=UPI0033D1BD00